MFKKLGQLWEMRGIIAPPCEINDTVYVVTKISKEITELKIIGFWICEHGYAFITDCGTINRNSLGKTVFLTRVAAEQALKER